ncbi:MAG: type II toxin-antitoxin system VapC family toxin [Polaromonas sp.]
MYLLDTNILIYAYRHLGGCRERLDAQSASDLSICAINIAEIEYGIAKSSRPEGLRLFLSNIQARYALQPLSVEAACQAGQLRAVLERQGQPIGAYDLLIAGVALANNLTVVTRNVREFARVPNLKVESWYD